LGREVLYDLPPLKLILIDLKGADPMSTYQDLEIDSVARIGLMYLDGDQFEEVLIDRFGDTDYNFEYFTHVKNSLTHMENMNPSLGLCAVLWQLYPDNPDIAVPVVAGKSLPLEGWTRTPVDRQIQQVFTTGQSQLKMGAASGMSHHYYPVKNSDDEIVGVLELIKGMNEITDM
jgi:hypothetical protein